MNVAIIFAGGSGQRMKNSGCPKQFLELYEKPIIIYTLEIFDHHPDIDFIVIPCIHGWEDRLWNMINKFHIEKVTQIVKGGKSSHESQLNALKYLKNICNDQDIILLHDAVRPNIDEGLITANIECVQKYGSAVSAADFRETGIVSEDKQTTMKTISRNKLLIAKAPQSFFFKDVLKAHELGENMSEDSSIDTCTLMTRLGKSLHLVPTDSSNIKITTPDDYFEFKAIIDTRSNKNIFGL